MNAIKSNLSRKIRQDLEEKLSPTPESVPSPRENEGSSLRVLWNWKRLLQKQHLVDQAALITYILWHMDEITNRILREKEDGKGSRTCEKRPGRPQQRNW